jgi:hypothetical protein
MFGFGRRFGSGEKARYVSPEARKAEGDLHKAMTSFQETVREHRKSIEKSGSFFNRPIEEVDREILEEMREETREFLNNLEIRKRDAEARREKAFEELTNMKARRDVALKEREGLNKKT